MKKVGFTLAEVLITLAIIGVVAALTIPSVVRNYQKTQTVTQLKKTYAALANTTNLAIAEQGPMTGWEIGQASSGDDAEKFVDTYMIPYLKILKNCGSKDNSGLCARDIYGQWARFYLADGTYIRVMLGNNYTFVQIDLNGQKKPNAYGKDMFELKYYVAGGSYIGKFMPECYTCARDHLINEATWGCNKNASKQLCMALIMKDGWQISDDYPW